MEHIHNIIEGCLRNDAKSQKALYEKYYGYALKTVFRYVYHYEKAKDVVNDGYVKLFLGINKFKYENDSAVEKLLMGWIRRIMINTAIDELRKNNMLPEIGGIPEYVWEETNSDLNADQRLLYKEMIAYVKTLPPVYRIVFNMFVIDGYSHQEIAHVLGISVGTSKSNLFKARNLLQKLINNDELENIYAANR